MGLYATDIGGRCDVAFIWVEAEYFSARKSDGDTR